MMTVIAVLLALIVLLLILISLSFWKSKGKSEGTNPVVESEPEAEPIEEVKEEIEDEPSMSLVFDPKNQPRVSTYSPKTDRTVLCTCHGRPFQEGDEAVLWPIPDSPAFHLLCEETVAKLQVVEK